MQLCSFACVWCGGWGGVGRGELLLCLSWRGNFKTRSTFGSMSMTDNPGSTDVLCMEDVISDMTYSWETWRLRNQKCDRR